jgi:hypothetical protein
MKERGSENKVELQINEWRYYALLRLSKETELPINFLMDVAIQELVNRYERVFQEDQEVKSWVSRN